MSSTTLQNAEFLYGVPLADLPRYSRKPPVGDEPTEVHKGVNYELLDEILAYIHKHPRQWEQGDWFRVVDTETGEIKIVHQITTVEEVNSCGTSMCFAGHAALREGFPAPPLRNGADWGRKVRDRNYRELVSEFARKRLGIMTSQAEELFSGDNDLEDLTSMVLALHIDPDVSWWLLSRFRHDDHDEILHKVLMRKLGVEETPEDEENW